MIVQTLAVHIWSMHRGSLSSEGPRSAAGGVPRAQMQVKTALFIGYRCAHHTDHNYIGKNRPHLNDVYAILSNNYGPTFIHVIKWA